MTELTEEESRELKIHCNRSKKTFRKNAAHIKETADKEKAFVLSHI